MREQKMMDKVTTERVANGVCNASAALTKPNCSLIV